MPQLILILVYITYWPSVLLISMVLFRIKPRHHIRQIILSTLLLTQTSILLQTYKAEFLLAFIQPICLMTCIFFFYKLKIIHSFIVAVVTFGFNLVIESAFNLFLANFNYIEFVKIYQNDYAIQGLILTLINCGVALLLQKLRLGFSFISSHPLNSKSSLYPKKIIIMVLTGCVLLAFTSLSIYFFEKFVIVCVTLTFFILIGVMNFLYEKELTD